MNTRWKTVSAFLLALAAETIAQRRFEPRVTERGRFDPPPLPAITADALVGIERRHPDTDVYLAIQYGTRPTDIMYLYMNSARTEEARDLLYIFAPDERGAIALKETMRGSSIATPARSGGGTVRGREFRIRGLESRVDDIRIRTDLNLISGYRQWDVLLLDATVTMESPPGKSSYRIGGLLHPYVAISPDGLKPLPVIGTPHFRAGPGKFDPSRLSVSLSIGDLPMMPGAGMGRDVRAVLTETSSGRAQQLRARWEDRPYLGVRPFEILASLDARIRRGASYTLTAEIDLGPIFGVFKSETTFTVPLGEKK